MPKKSALDMNKNDIFIMGGEEHVVEHVTYAPGKVKIRTKTGKVFTYNNTKKITLK